MKRFAITSLFYFITVVIFAQEKHTDLPVINNVSQTYSAHKECVIDSFYIDNNVISNITPIYNKVKETPNKEFQNTYFSPNYNYFSPFYSLHQGLNLGLSATAFASFGKYSPSGIGFSQRVSAAYLLPIKQKWTVLMEGFFNNVAWNKYSYRNAGLFMAIGYQLNKHWEFYLYGQKSIMSQKQNAFLWRYDPTIGDRIGVTAKYNFNPSFSIEVSVEQRWNTTNAPLYFDTYNYPLSKP